MAVMNGWQYELEVVKVDRKIDERNGVGR